MQTQLERAAAIRLGYFDLLILDCVCRKDIGYRRLHHVDQEREAVEEAEM
jgi:hypothetical protein